MPSREVAFVITGDVAHKVVGVPAYRGGPSLPAGNVRLLESGGFRLLEDGSFRLLEE